MRRTITILFALLASLLPSAQAATVAYVSSSATIGYEGLTVELVCQVSKPASYSTPAPTAIRPTLTNGTRTITLEPFGASWSDVDTNLTWRIFYAIPPPDRVLKSESTSWTLSWTGGAIFADADSNATATSLSSAAVVNGSKVGSDGWTDHTGKSWDGTFYISNSGSDSNNGTSTNTPLATIAAAKAKLVNGEGRRLLFQRGGTWTGGFGELTVSGRSAELPILISYYGSSGNPPTFNLSSGNFLQTRLGTPRQHIAVEGVNINANGETAFQLAAPTSTSGGIRIEGVKIDNPGNGITAEIDPGFRPTAGNYDTHAGVDNVHVYRCVITDAMGGTHNQGFYAFDARHARIFECVFDHNGWINASLPSNQGHNFYFHGHTEDWRIFYTISAWPGGNGWSMNCPGFAGGSYVYAANSGAQQRGDVMTTGPYPAFSGLARCVVEGGADSTLNGVESSNLAQGIHLNAHWDENISGIPTTPGPQTATSCAVIQKRSSVQGDAAAYTLESYSGAGTPRKFGLISSYAYRWRDRDLACIGQNDRWDVRNCAFVEDNNQAPRGHLFACWANSLNATLLKFSGNSYFSSSPANLWFGHSEGFSSISQATWAAFETGESFSAPAFNDPTRNLGRYHASIGGVGTADAFLTAARAMDRFTWDDRYTGRAVTEYVLAGFATGGISGSPPPAPSNVRVTGKTSTTLTLALDPPASGSPTSYTFQRMSGASVAASYTNTLPTASATSLTGSTNYTFQAIATNAFGDSATSSQVTLRTAPAAITGLGLTAGTSSITCAWTATGDAQFQEYRVYKSTAGSSGPWTLAGSPKTNAFTITPATVQTWVYVTQADVAGWESDASTVENATPDVPGDPPDAPINVTLTATPSGVNIDWPDTPGATYTVYIGTTSGNHPISFPRTVSNASFANVVVGRRYYVAVTATNAEGTSAKSTEVSIVIPTPRRNAWWWWSRWF